MTYREALETLNGMMAAGSRPLEIATFISELFSEVRAAVTRTVEGLKLPVGTFGEVVCERLAARRAVIAGEYADKSRNPVYPALPSVNKFRKLAAKRDLTAEETKAYGRSVLESIRELQRSELLGRKSELSHKPPTLAQVFAGTYQRATVPASHETPGKYRQDKPATWNPVQRTRYEAAMAEKRAAAPQIEAPQAAPVMTVVPASKPAKPAPDHSARMRKAWETRRANAAKRAA